MQAHLPFDLELMRKNFPFSKLSEKGANTLIFPELAAGNITYNLMRTLIGIEALGPILLGMAKPVHVLQIGSSEREIMNMVAYAVVDSDR